jgi:hypothetical protein
VRRFSTDSILGERLDTIGRRLSRDIASDLANSPPDLGHRFETFGKIEKFDTFSGKTGEKLTKSADDLDKPPREKSKFDTFCGAIDEIKPVLPAKKNLKAKQKRKPLSVDVYTSDSSSKSQHQVKFDNQSTLSKRDSIREESYRETLHPAIYQIDSLKAVQRRELHEELREKYGTEKRAMKTKPPKVPSTVHRPPAKNPNESYLKVQSNESLDIRPVPSPRTKSRNYSEDDDEGMDPTYATIQRKNKPSSREKLTSPRVSNNSLPLGRLSKEDLLNLTHRTESEIHEFLNGKATQNKNEPP